MRQFFGEILEKRRQFQLEPDQCSWREAQDEQLQFTAGQRGRTRWIDVNARVEAALSEQNWGWYSVDKTYPLCSVRALSAGVL